MPEIPANAKKKRPPKWSLILREYRGIFGIDQISLDLLFSKHH
jgi:hypothetical protein